MDTQRLRVTPRSIVHGGGALDDAYLVTPNRLEVVQQVINVAFQERRFGGKLLGSEELDRDDVVESTNDPHCGRRQGVGVPRSEIESAADITAEEIHGH